jgi:hypothetical protein
MAIPKRDMNQELEKTRGLAYAVKVAAKGLLGDEKRSPGAGDPEIAGFLESLEILADRLDDLCEMSLEEAAAVHELRLRAGGARVA